MKRLFLITLFLLFAVTCYAGQKAITDTGEQVILNSDGTWNYIDKEQKTEKKIETNKTKFNRPVDSTFLLKSTQNQAAFWINPAKWSFNKSTENSAKEYEFRLKDKELFGMAITETLEVPLESITEIALINAREVAPDIKVVKQEYRVVNGKKVIYMEMTGTMKGIAFTYLGYYYSSPAGTTQLVAYTLTSSVNKYAAEIIDFLNGLDTQ
ncbi:MAG: hypothetical protein ABSC11_04700 [Smithella sp.]|jgi:hypothetical protein